MKHFYDEEPIDDETRAAFLAMSREEQLLSILNMERYLRGEIAAIKKRQIDFENNAKSYRRYREKRERELIGDIEGGEENGDRMSITQKVMKVAAREVADALAKRFDFWTYFRDKVLPPLLVGFILALLYVVYGQGIP